MTDRPILFSAPMVRALLDGRKTQTRRVLGLRGACNIFAPGVWSDSYVLDPGNADWRERDTPFAVGDRLWVRESGLLTPTNYGGLFRHDVPETPEVGHYWSAETRDKGASYNVRGCSRASAKSGRTKVTPSIHMPRWASRLTLIVDEVRVERLQDISEADAIAEGTREPSLRQQGGELTQAAWSERQVFQRLWNSINGPEAWDANPWVVAVSFRVERQNIDRIAA